MIDNIHIISQPSMHSKIQHIAFDLILYTNELHNLKHHMHFYVMVSEVEKFMNSEWHYDMDDGQIRAALKAYLIRYSDNNQQF